MTLSSLQSAISGKIRNMRVKRSRNTDQQQQFVGSVLDDDLLNMDPSLMTERQQLAFLLRTTAPRKTSDSLSSESSEDELLTKKIKRIHRNESSTSTSSKSSPKSKSINNNSHSTTIIKEKGVVVYKGRGRPPKNAIKLPHGKSLLAESTSSSSNNSPRSVSTIHRSQNPKKLKVNASSSSNSSISSSPTTYQTTKHTTESPSSASDASNVEIFQGSPLSSKTRADFWSFNCALCCTHTQSGCFSSSDVLFLCTSCDQKYPTQRALGKV